MRLTYPECTYSEREVRAMTSDYRRAHAIATDIGYSEAACHLGVAGQRRLVMPITRNMAWILNDDGTTFSFPVTRGEAGLRYDNPC